MNDDASAAVRRMQVGMHVVDSSPGILWSEPTTSYTHRTSIHMWAYYILEV